MYQISIFLLGYLNFFLHFSFTFMDNLFKKHPIFPSTCPCCRWHSSFSIRYDVGGVGGVASIGIVHKKDAEAAWKDWIGVMGLAGRLEDKEEGGGGGGIKGNKLQKGEDESPLRWASFVKDKALGVLAGRPNATNSGKNLVKYVKQISKDKR